MRTHRFLSAALVLGLAVAAPATAQREEGQSPQDIKSSSSETIHEEPCDGGTVFISGDPALWPPNHKYSPYDIEAIADDEGSDVRLGTSAYHDEYVTPFMPAPPQDDEYEQPEEEDEEVGAGNTSDDARPFLDYDQGTGSAATFHELRSERSGRGDGRTYTLEFWAQFDNGQPCTGSTTVEVPHDMRSHKAPPKDDKTGSTGPNQDD